LLATPLSHRKNKTEAQKEIRILMWKGTHKILLCTPVDVKFSVQFFCFLKQQIRIHIGHNIIITVNPKYWTNFCPDSISYKVKISHAAKLKKKVVDIDSPMQQLTKSCYYL
jgi:hypothetical protein